MSSGTLHIEVSGLITVEFTGGDEPRIRELFGSNRIPTPFTFDGVKDVENLGASVLRQIQAKNPGVTVQWSAERCAEFAAFQSLQEFRR